MSLRTQIEQLRPGEVLITDKDRASVYIAAKRAGVEVTTAKNDNGILTVTRKGDTLTLADQVAALSPKDRLELFERFELCCGMNRGECVCEPDDLSALSEGEASYIMAADDRQAKLEALREMINNPQPEPDDPEPVEDVWKFVPGVQHFGETDQYYRGQVCGKRKRTVEVDGSDYERVLRVV